MPAPVVTISARGAERLRAGHPWIYVSDIRASEARSGDLVEIRSERGRPLGAAFWSNDSQISLRFLGAEAVDDERQMFQARIEAALAFRRALAIDATAWRAVNAEGDRLPGLIIDVYGDPGDRVVVVQALTQAIDSRLDLVTAIIQDVLQPRGVLARNDQKVRRLEGLPEEIRVLAGDVPAEVEVREGSLRYRVDLYSAQKTGLFLDQRENHSRAAEYARGRALDGFSYHGGFALAIAPRCESVLALDASATAVAATQANATRNGLSNVAAREANVFDELRELEIARERFDTIVLDPPAFAKNRGAVARAVAGYKEINLRALKLLLPGGVLVTCSCSYHVLEPLFQEVLESAAADARVTVSLVEKRTQARDHPVLLGVPETQYLKCFILRRVS